MNTEVSEIMSNVDALKMKFEDALIEYAENLNEQWKRLSACQGDNKSAVQQLLQDRLDAAHFMDVQKVPVSK